MNIAEYDTTGVDAANINADLDADLCSDAYVLMYWCWVWGKGWVWVWVWLWLCCRCRCTCWCWGRSHQLPPLLCKLQSSSLAESSFSPSLSPTAPLTHWVILFIWMHLTKERFENSWPRSFSNCLKFFNQTADIDQFSACLKHDLMCIPHICHRHHRRVCVKENCPV